MPYSWCFPICELEQEFVVGSVFPVAKVGFLPCSCDSRVKRITSIITRLFLGGEKSRNSDNNDPGTRDVNHETVLGKLGYSFNQVIQ